MSGDKDFSDGLMAAIARVVRDHEPSATGAGYVSGFVLAFDWVDVTDAAGEHLVIHQRDPQVAARTMLRRLNAAAGRPGSSRDDR